MKNVGRCRTGIFRFTQALISLWLSQTHKGMGLVVASRSNELSNREFREKQMVAQLFLKPGGVFPHPKCAKQVPSRRRMGL